MRIDLGAEVVERYKELGAPAKSDCFYGPKCLIHA
jgi:hypothetical protein